MKKLELTCAPPLLATTRFRSLLAFTTEAVTASCSAVAKDIVLAKKQLKNNSGFI